MLNAPERSLVLVPHGPPARPSARTALERVALACGGDLQRVIDGPAGEVDRFARHVARIAEVADERAPRPLVLLTPTTPLPLMVVTARRTLEQVVPALRTARWVVMVDTDEDPSFAETASKLGSLEGPLAACPVWLCHDGGVYLVCPADASEAAVPARMLDYDAARRRQPNGPVSPLGSGRRVPGGRR